MRERDFRLLFTGRALSLLGDAVLPAALALAVLRATGSTSALALVLACAVVPKLVLLPVGGVLADRFRARTVALITDVVRCGVQLFTGLQLLSGEPSLALIAGAEALGGAASAFAMPCLYPLVAGTVRKGARQRANAALATVESACKLGGPALAGVLVFTVGPGWAFVLDSATFALSAALLAAVRVRQVPLPKRSFRADLAEGWAEVRARPWYGPSLASHAVANMCISVLLVLGPGVAVARLGGEGVWVAALQTGAVGLLIGNTLAGRFYPRRPVLVANLLSTLFALPLALFALAPPAPYAVGAYGVAMVGLGYLNPVWQTTVQNTVPPTALARVTSYDWLVSLGAMPLGYALAPLAAERWDPAVPLGVAAALVAGSVWTAAVRGVRTFTVPKPGTETETSTGTESGTETETGGSASGVDPASPPAPRPAPPSGTDRAAAPDG